MQSSKEAIITKILDQGKSLDGDSSQEFQKLELKITNSDEYLEILNQEQPFSRWNPYETEKSYYSKY